MDIIRKYFPDLDTDQISKLERLPVLYSEWNEKINVVSRKDIESLMERHVLHSLGIAKVMSFVGGTKVLDVGTGGGFPGIPLAILFPDVEFYLVDSIAKKIKVVQAIADELGLKNVKATQDRAENVKDKFDFIVSRAVTRMPEFLKWIEKSVIFDCKNDFPNGVLYLKGGDLSQELGGLSEHYNEFDLSDYFEEEFYETKKVVYVQLV